MDSKIKHIEDKQVVERYLRGRLTPPEARFFEQVVKQSPEIVERIGLPETLKRMMRLLDDTGTEWREQPPKFWHQPWVPATLAGVAVLAFVVALAMWSGKRTAVQNFGHLKTELAAGILNAPINRQVLHLKPALPQQAVPTVPIGARVGPTLAEIRINLSGVQATLYTVTVKRDDGTFFMRLDNQLKDSNGDLRIGVNSGAFPAGVYDVALETVNLRGGDGELVGRLRLRIDTGI